MKIENDWWKTAFGADYLEAFQNIFPEQTEAEVAFILNLAPQKGSVLDLACGAGRHSIALAKEGYQVTGVDLAADALVSAKKNAKQADVFVKFVEKDLRTLDLHRTFNLVLLLGNSFGYGTDADQQEVLVRVARHLSPDGFFIFGIHNALRTLGSLKDKDTRTQTIEVGVHRFQVTETYQFDPHTLVKTSFWTVIRDGQEMYRHGARVRFYLFPELKIMFMRAGLCVDRIFGSYQSKPYRASSPYLILVVKMTRTRVARCGSRCEGLARLDRPFPDVDGPVVRRARARVNLFGLQRDGSVSERLPDIGRGYDPFRALHDITSFRHRLGSAELRS